MVCQIRLLFSWNGASLAHLFSLLWKVVNSTFQYCWCCIPTLYRYQFSIYYPFQNGHFLSFFGFLGFFFFTSLADVLQLSPLALFISVKQIKLFFNTFLEGTAELWNQSPTITGKHSSYFLSQSQKLRPMSKLSLGLSRYGKLKKEKFFGGKLLLSFLWL